MFHLERKRLRYACDCLPAEEPNEPYSSPTLRFSLRLSRLRLFLSHFQRMRPFFFHFLGLDPNKSPNEYCSSSVALLLTNTYKKAPGWRCEAHIPTQFINCLEK
jgi:hypothetical protein